MRSDAEVLEAAAARVERGHCKGSYAMDAQGKATLVRAGDAVSFCAVGALLEEIGYGSVPEAQALLKRVGTSKDELFEFNDAPATTKEMVAGRLRGLARVARGEEVQLG